MKIVSCLLLASFNLWAASGSFLVSPPRLPELGSVQNKQNEGIYQRIREGYERIQKGIKNILEFSFIDEKKKSSVGLLLPEEDIVKHHEPITQKRISKKKHGFLNLALHRPEVSEQDFEVELQNLEALEESGKILDAKQRYQLELLRTYFFVHSRVYSDKQEIKKQVIKNEIPILLIPIGPVLGSIYQHVDLWNRQNSRAHSINEGFLESFNATGSISGMGRMRFLLCKLPGGVPKPDSDKILTILKNNQLSPTHVFSAMVLLDRYFVKNQQISALSMRPYELIVVSIYISEMVLGKKGLDSNNFLSVSEIERKDFDELLIQFSSQIGFNFYLPVSWLRELWVALLNHDLKKADVLCTSIVFNRPVSGLQWLSSTEGYVELSRGSYGYVYRKEEEVLKLLGTRLKEDFFCETCIGFGICSPHLVQFSGVCYFEQDQVRRIGILMPYCGQNLNDVRNSGSQPIHTRKYMRQILEALKHLHENGWMHGDVKLQNIFVDQTREKLRLGDFGLAWLFGGAVVNLKQEIQTAHYRAPELYLNSQDWRPCSDVFAAGVIMAELSLIRQEYFFYKNNQTKEAVRSNILSCAEYLAEGTEGIAQKNSPWAKNFEELRAQLGEAGYRVLLRMLDPDPDNRITAAKALQDPYFVGPAPIDSM